MVLGSDCLPFFQDILPTAPRSERGPLVRNNQLPSGSTLFSNIGDSRVQMITALNACKRIEKTNPRAIVST